MISKLLRILSYLSKAPSEARHVAVDRRLDRLDGKQPETRQTGNQTLLKRSVLRAIEAWRPPNGSTVQMVVCVKLGSRVLFHVVNPKQSEDETLNRLDRLAHCLICTEEPDLPDEWVNELKKTWNHFEEKIGNAIR